MGGTGVAVGVCVGVGVTVGVGAAARPTVIAYCLFAPPGAVTTSMMVFSPTTKSIAADGCPDTTAAPFTTMPAWASAVVGVTTTDVCKCSTVTV